VAWLPLIKKIRHGAYPGGIKECGLRWDGFKRFSITTSSIGGGNARLITFKRDKKTKIVHGQLGA
jgi:hypothetical protein